MSDPTLLPAAPSASAASAASAASVAPSDSARLRDVADLPGPRGLPLIGNAMQIDSIRLHLQMEQWAREFGPFYRFSIGPRTFMVVADHTLVAALLRDRPNGFRRTQRLELIGGELGLLPGLFGVNDDVWQRQRRMVMASFDPAHVKRYFPSMLSVGKRLAGRWRDAADSGRSIDLQADLMRYTVDTIAGLAFGAEVNTLESDGDVIQKQLDKIFPTLFKRLVAPFPTWRWFKTAADRQVEQDVADVMKAVDGFIAQARQRMADDPSLRSAPTNLLESMIVAAEQPGSGIDDAQVAGNVITMLLAGEDTTANTLAWLIHLLWRHPTILARVTEEVRRVCGDVDSPTMEQLGQLELLDDCINETMRLKPIAPVIAHQALRPTQIGDVRVPTGQVVWCLLRKDSISDEFVPDAERFDPDRWRVQTAATASDSAAPAGGSAAPAGGSAASAGGSAAATGGSPASAGGSPAPTAAAPVMAGAASPKRLSMPFGAGPRICPGRYLALLEMKLAISTLLNRFEIIAVDTPDGQMAQERLAFSMAPVGLTMRLKNR